MMLNLTCLATTHHSKTVNIFTPEVFQHQHGQMLKSLHSALVLEAGPDPFEADIVMSDKA